MDAKPSNLSPVAMEAESHVRQKVATISRDMHDGWNLSIAERMLVDGWNGMLYPKLP